MLNNSKGITLLSLVITIVIMTILITVVGLYSIDSIRNAYIASEKKELADMVEYVSSKKVKLLNEEFDVNDEYNSGKSPVITSEGLYLLASGLNETDLNKIIDVNTSEYLVDNYKYVYITSDMLNSETIVTDDIIIKDAKNDYIVNFYTGTVIALYDGGKRVEISGIIYGLNDIMNEIL